MPYAAQHILIVIAATIAGIDAYWVFAAHIDVDILPYGFAGLLASALFAGAYFYDRIRGEKGLAAMLFATGFLTVFSGSCGLLNYLMLTAAGPRIDNLLAVADRAMGVDWPALMALTARHPILDGTLAVLYQTVLPQIVVLITLLAWHGKIESIYRLCLSMAIGALTTVCFWTLFPSFGAFSIYHLEPGVSSKLTLVLDEAYAKSLIGLLQNGPGHIVPANIKGLVGFPSFHAVETLLVVWYARELKGIRWATIALNLGVLVSIPIQGGHHVVDIIGGFAVTVAAIALTFTIMKAVAAMQNRELVRSAGEATA